MQGAVDLRIGNLRFGGGSLGKRERFSGPVGKPFRVARRLRMQTPRLKQQKAPPKRGPRRLYPVGLATGYY